MVIVFQKADIYKCIISVYVVQRKAVLTGSVEPTDEECEWHSEGEGEELAVSIYSLQTQCDLAQVQC